MNKFFALTLLALVACVSCGSVSQSEQFGWSQAAAEADGDDETVLLMGKEKLFSDFCLDQAHKIKKDVSDYTRNTTVFITKVFFDKFNDITNDVIAVQKDAVAQLTAQLAKPDSEIASNGQANLSEDQIAKLIEEGKRSIQESSAIAGVVPATKTAVAAMLSAANSAVFTRLAKARAYVSGINLYESFKNACDQVAMYEENMSAALEETKQELLASVEDAETQQFVESTTIVGLNCFTTKNIVRLHGFCDIVQAGHTHFFKMLGMASPLKE